MSYEHKFSIIKGIRVGADVCSDDCERFAKIKPDGILAKSATESEAPYYIGALTDYIYDYLHNSSQVIDGEFTDGTYYGEELYSVGEYDHSDGTALADILDKSEISEEMKEFISTLYPDEEIKIWIVHWVL